ncbi:MAG: DUF2892 domain-containing protein [Pseudoxanthomonas suwonensis]|nr:DUF2892 domain-containing protein [Pseudoxanthomonas suwonensis]
MRANIGSTDRLIRIVLGIVLIAAVFFTTAPLKWVLLVAGIIDLATGLLRFCGLYRLLGINTRGA